MTEGAKCHGSGSERRRRRRGRWGKEKSEFVYLDIYDSAYLEFTSLKLLHHRPSFPKRLFTSEKDF